MNIAPDTYVPSLRWRMGEYQALSRLSEEAKARVVPFVVIPEIEFDFEEWAPKKTVQEHVGPFAKRFRQKWGMRPAWIDVHPKIHAQPMDSGKLPIAHVFDELHVVWNNAVPVTSLDGSPAINAAVAAIVKTDGLGVGIRVRIEHVMKPGCKPAIDALMKSIGVAPADTDLIVDLGAPNYEPYADFADGLIAAMSAFGDLSAFRSYIVMGSAYPQTVGLGKPGGDLPRHDWLFYQTLVGKLDKDARIPNYSDYTIVNPEFTPRDMRRIRSGGKVVYTESKTWYVRKGGAFRDNPAQMHDHCKYILDSGKFRGPTFSDGDAYIEKCANKKVRPSNQPFWKQVAISHHIMHVLDDLSKLGGGA
jgi:hypothetical protein